MGASSDPGRCIPVPVADNARTAPYMSNLQPHSRAAENACLDRMFVIPGVHGHSKYFHKRRVGLVNGIHYRCYDLDPIFLLKTHTTFLRDISSIQ